MKALYHCSKSAFLAFLMSSVVAVLASGCGGTVGGEPATESGTLGVYLTDAPACGYDAVNVTVLKVRAHKSSSAADTDAGWSDLVLTPARKINLLDLSNGVLDKLGETALAEGHYTQLRLVLDPNSALGLSNSVVPTGGVETALVTPSAVQSGIKLINQFDVVSGQRVDLVLDFDACKSVVKRGNGSYALKPVVKVVPFALNGITGFVDIPLLGGTVMATAQQNGEIVQSAAPNAQTGEFFLSRLALGNYDVVVTADGRATAVIAAVPVLSATGVTVLSSSAAPVTMPVSATGSISGMETLSPTSTTEVAYAAAKQSLGTATNVTVSFVAADESNSGAYALTLPAGAPLLGQYSAALPISLLEQTSVAGKYTVQATATGYTSQTSAVVDISTANATLDFILLP